MTQYKWMLQMIDEHGNRTSERIVIAQHPDNDHFVALYPEGGKPNRYVAVSDLDHVVTMATADQRFPLTP